MSRSTFVKKRLYSRCKIACSMPPMYWSTGIQRFTRSEENGQLGVVRIGITHVIPARARKRVHGVGFTTRGLRHRTSGRCSELLMRGKRFPSGQIDVPGGSVTGN